MKSELAIKRELKRVEKLRKNKRLSVSGWFNLQGAEQALAWALEDNAAAPATCVFIRPPERKAKVSK